MVFRREPSPKRTFRPAGAALGGGIPRRCRFCSIGRFYALMYWCPTSLDVCPHPEEAR
ncbi:L-serine ammonia-lyase domain protein [Burkholderia cepacia]|nr:L-serine ammonia-lyase domain protein [Burkholderia cepacia]QOH37527.1 L-serine ammonia-lyase domain protein [Burkholderia cepacia]